MKSHLHAKKARQLVQDSLRVAPTSGCDRTTLRCANARSYGSQLNPCCRSHIKQIVMDTLPILESFGVTVWADYGTLLGAVRNPLTTWKDYPWLPQGNRSSEPIPPGIIPHDKDADFGIFLPHVDDRMAFYTMSRVRTKLERLGYRVLVRPQGRSLKVRLSPTNATNADFFRWRETRGGFLDRLKFINVDNYKGRGFLKDVAFPLGTVQWEGMTLPAPKDPAAFCQFRYGPNWKTPVQANHDGVRR